LTEQTLARVARTRGSIVITTYAAEGSDPSAGRARAPSVRRKK
jgi:hypothetical protein